MAYSNRELRHRDFAAGRRYKSEDTQHYHNDNEYLSEKRNSENHIYSSDYVDNFYTNEKNTFLGTENYSPRPNTQPENRNHNSSNDSGFEGVEEHTYNARGKRFRRMVSSASLQSQVIPEDPNQAAYLTRQQRHALTRVSSYPSRLVAANQTPINAYPTRQERAGLRNRTDISKSSQVNGGTQAWNHPSQAQHTSSYWAPTLLVCFVLSLGLCYICYTLAHIVPLTQEIPTVHSGEQLKKEVEPLDYIAVYLLKIGHVKLLHSIDFVQEHWWLMGPMTLGVTVTLVTLKILHYDSIGGPKVPPTPSLHLGNVVAVLNGILMCLYFLFYNLKVKPEEEKAK